MSIHTRLPAFASAAWILISSSLVLPLAVGAESPAAGGSLTLEQMTGDLAQRANTLAEEANQLATSANPAATSEQASKIASARMEISRALILRSKVTGNKVIPTDPYYKALRRQRLAEANLQVAQVWWKHGRTGTPLESAKSFESLSLATTLEEEKKTADEEVTKTKPAAPAAPEDKSRMNLNPAVAARLKQGGSILDQVQNWENLSVESKSKIIAR